MLKIDVLTLFPGMFKNVLSESMLKIAQKKRKVDIRVHNIRNWTTDRHKTADDKPYGGGSGMVMKVEPVYNALSCLAGPRLRREASRRVDLSGKEKPGKDMRVILLTPRGKKFDQKTVKKLSGVKHIVLICGHYEGVDERIRSLVTDEISIGDYILTGGEIPAMSIIDSVVRLLPGVLGGGASSAACESFENNLLEYPQYTRPRAFEGMEVPEVLLSGDHGAIEKWRKKEAVKVTKKLRKDLIGRSCHEK